MTGALEVAQRLGICIGNDEVDFMYSAGDHGVDGISAAAAHADHFDYGTLVNGFIKFKHLSSPLRIDSDSLIGVKCNRNFTQESKEKN